MALIKNKKYGNVWDIPVDSEAYRRCKAHPDDYEELPTPKTEPKKPEKSG